MLRLSASSFFKRLRLPVAAMGMALTAFSVQGYLYLNWDFSDGLTGWETAGSVTAGGGGAILSDQNTLRSLLFQGVHLEPGTYVLSFDFLHALSPEVPFGWAQDAFFTTLYFSDTPLLFDPATASGFQAALPLFDLEFTGIRMFSGTVSDSALGTEYSLYQTSFDLIDPVSAFIVFDFNNLNNINADSTVFIDNVLLVPEPSLATLLLLGGAGLLRRASRRGRRV